MTPTPLRPDHATANGACGLPTDFRKDCIGCLLAWPPWRLAALSRRGAAALSRLPRIPQLVAGECIVKVSGHTKAAISNVEGSLGRLWDLSSLPRQVQRAGGKGKGVRTVSRARFAFHTTLQRSYAGRVEPSTRGPRGERIGLVAWWGFCFRLAAAVPGCPRPAALRPRRTAPGAAPTPHIPAQPNRSWRGIPCRGMVTAALW